jgi:hypothetical protein
MMAPTTHLATLALAPTFAKGLLVYACAIVLFIGSVYMLTWAILGLRMGYLVVATAFFGWMIILSALWAFGAPGTPKNLGPRGTEPHWQVMAAGVGEQSTRFPETSHYPNGWWIPAPKSTAASSEPAVVSAIQNYLVLQAEAQLTAQGKEQTIDPSTFVVQNVRFETSGKTHLASGQAYFTSGGPLITVFAYHDHGNVPIYSIALLLASIIGFAIHVPFLDRAEKSRKEILTGGVAPPWYGPA